MQVCDKLRGGQKLCLCIFGSCLAENICLCAYAMNPPLLGYEGVWEYRFRRVPSTRTQSVSFGRGHRLKSNFDLSLEALKSTFQFDIDFCWIGDARRTLTPIQYTLFETSNFEYKATSKSRHLRIVNIFMCSSSWQSSHPPKTTKHDTHICKYLYIEDCSPG